MLFSLHGKQTLGDTMVPQHAAQHKALLEDMSDDIHALRVVADKCKTAEPMVRKRETETGRQRWRKKERKRKKKRERVREFFDSYKSDVSYR